MPERFATPDEVKQIEAYADDYFRRESRVSERWIPPAIDQLLDVGEEIITGHRAPQDEYARARARLTLTTTNNISLGIKTVTQFGLTRKEAPPEDLKKRTVKFLGLCQAYVSLEDAFTSYWKGYATAVLEKSNILRFDTVPNELDMRLRSHSADDELGGDHPVFPAIGLDQLGPILATLPTRSSLHQEGGFRYKLKRNHILDIAKMYADALRRSYRNVPKICSGGITFDDLLEGWAILLAVSRLHQLRY